MIPRTVRSRRNAGMASFDWACAMDREARLIGVALSWASRREDAKEDAGMEAVTARCSV
jgi:hypothetical protein